MKQVVILALLIACAPTVSGHRGGTQDETWLDLEGTWNQVSYVKAENQIRYETLGYMMFGKEHWLHISYFNRDEREKDFAEAHHGTYTITGSDTLDMNVDVEMHMDPKKEFQDQPVFYGSAASLTGAKYRVEGERVIIDLPSTAQIVLERLE